MSKVRTDGGQEEVQVLADLVVIDGYPPSNVERLWCQRMDGGECILDSIPFYADGYALGDAVNLKLGADQELHLDGLKRSSGNSTVRAIFMNDIDLNEVLALRDRFREKMCESEFDLQRMILAMNVPKAVPFETVSEILDEFEPTELEWWIGVLRHEAA